MKIIPFVFPAQKNVESYMANCFDIIGMFLCIQLILRYQLMCHKRCVPSLDKYWESLQAVIWPRFEHVFRLNTNSIRECDPTKFKKELGPHYVSDKLNQHALLLALMR